MSSGNSNTTQTLTVNLQGSQSATANLAQLKTQAQQAQQALQQAQAQLASLNAAMAHFQGLPKGATVTQAQMAQAIQLPSQIAQTQQNIPQLQKQATQAQQAYNNAQAQQTAIQQRVLASMTRTSGVIAAVQSQQQKYNQTIQNAVQLNQQLAQALNGTATAAQNASNQQGFLGTIGSAAGAVTGGVGSAANAVGQGVAAPFSNAHTYAGYAARQTLYDVVSSTGVPGAGIAAGATADALGAMADALPGLGKAALAVGAAAATVLAAQGTADSMMSSMNAQVGSSVALDGEPRSALTKQVLQAGQDFLVPIDQNTQYARQMGQSGVNATDLPDALKLSYGFAAQTGMDLGSSVSMVSDLMVKQKMGIDGAAKSLQQYAEAAAAARIPMQRMYDMLQTNEQNGASLQTNEAGLASLQAQLGLGIDPSKLQAPANTSTGANNLQLEALLGVNHDQLIQAQHSAPQMFDLQTAALKRLSGGNIDVAEMIMPNVGLDTTGLTPDQVNNLVKLMLTSTPGAAEAYYQHNVAPQMAVQQQQALTANQAIAKGKAIRTGQVSPADAAKTTAAYDALWLFSSGKIPGTGIDLSDPGKMLHDALGGATLGDIAGGTVKPLGDAADWIGKHIADAAKGPDVNPGTIAAGTLQGAGQAVSDLGSAVNWLERTITGSGHSPSHPIMFGPPPFNTSNKPSTNVQALYQLPNDQTGLSNAIPAGARPYLNDFRKAAEKTGIPLEILIAQAQAESNFNPHAVSPAGAIGISQFMPATAKAMGIDPRDPQQSIMAQAELLRVLWQQMGSLPGALAAYNEGPSAAQAGKMPAETAKYIAQITANAQKIAQKVDVQVDVTVKNEQGQMLPSRTTTRTAPTTAPISGPGQRRP